MTNTQQTEIEAAAFRHLIKHLQEHSEVQNIDLMNLAAFCRNCLAKWYATAASEPVSYTHLTLPTICSV